MKPTMPPEMMGVRLHWTDSDPKYMPSSTEVFYTAYVGKGEPGADEDGYVKGVFFEMVTPVDDLGYCLALTTRRYKGPLRVVLGGRVVAKVEPLTDETFLEARAMQRSAPRWEVTFGLRDKPEDPSFSFEVSEHVAHGIMRHLDDRILVRRAPKSWHDHGTYAARRDPEQPLLDKIKRLEDENHTLREAFKILSQP